MAKKKRYLAMDFGGRNGVAAAGAFDGDKLEMETLLRFPVATVKMLDTMFWGFPGMLAYARDSLSLYAAKHGSTLAGVACDAPGGDFGLLDKTGHLLANPVSGYYAPNGDTPRKISQTLPARSVYQKTGIKARPGNTIQQLHAMAAANSPLLDKAVTMLLMADLVAYFLTGVPAQEYTLAATTGMYDAMTRDWSRDLILSAGIPPVMLPEIIAPGTVIGPLRLDIAADCGLGETPVIAPGSHAPAGAVAAIPAEGEDWLYVVSGGRNRVGVELTAPIVNDASFGRDFSNEGGVDGSIRFQKDTMGWWLLDCCAAVWESREGGPVDRTALIAEAAKSAPFQRLVNLDDPRFRDPRMMREAPEAINAALTGSEQKPMTNRAEYVRLCLESQALAVRRAVEETSELTGRKHRVVHVVGRGAANPLLNQFIADAVGLPVKAGPTEAKAVGNIVMQAIALGDIGSLSEAREIVARSFDVAVYEPSADRAAWDDAYGKFAKMG